MGRSLSYRAALLAVVLACGVTNAAEPPPQAAGDAPVLPRVGVSALRDPVEKSYRKIVRGMDLFEQQRRLAPEAPLRFKLLPRHRDTDMQGIALSIVGDSVSIPVPIAPDNTFTLERSQRALDEDAVVVPNRKARSMTWRTDVRTPGLPPNTRRLGDLRLECLVGLEADLISNVQPFFGQLVRLLRGRGYCEQRDVQYLFFAERPLWSVTLVAGNRREVLPVDRLYAGITRNPMSEEDLRYCDCEVLLDRTYYAPLGDPSWPDDTLIELTYMDEAVASPAIGQSTKADVIAAHGKPRVIRFDSGYEVWVYRLDDPKKAKRGAPGELVMLFAPSGLLAKTRLNGVRLD